MFASSQRAAKGKHYRNAKHCCYSAYFPWALRGAGWISWGIVCAYSLKWNTCIPHSCSWFPVAVLTNKFIPKLGLTKSKCEGANLCLEPQAESGTLLSWPRSSTRGRVIISITLCFLLGSRCPAHGLCLAAAQHNCGKDRSGPCWVLFPHSLKGAKLGGCCLVPRFPGLRQTWRAPQNDAGNLYLLTCHSVTVFIGECLLYFPLFLEGSIFGPQKSRARTCIYLARG